MDTQPDRQQDTPELEPQGEERELDPRRCGRPKGDGTRCKAFKVKGRDACAGHLGLGIGADPAAYAAMASKRAAEVRVDTAERRHKRLRDALTDAVEGELYEPIIAAYRRGLESEDPTVSLRAAEGLLSRVYGKPKETIENVEVPKDLSDLEGLTLQELNELWARTRGALGDLDGVTAA